MVDEEDGLLEAGGAALAEGNWEGARATFAELVVRDPSPHALYGLASAQWWLGRTAEAMEGWEQAYAGYLRTGGEAEAVGVAVELSLLYNANFGNRAVSAGWAGRASRLADALGEPVLQAWVLVARAATALEPDRAEAWGREALAVAAEVGDRDLELCALSTIGSALVAAGRVDEGTALLDEAMAGAIGGERGTLDTVVFTSCVLMQSCYRCADFPRIIQWLQPLERFVARYGCPYVNATCRAHYGAVLVATGDWRRAEEELLAAIELAGANALPAVQAEAYAYLAELRLAEGRVDEAIELVQGFEDQPVVVPVLAAARLAGGQSALASAVVDRRRTSAAAMRLEGARLAEVVGQVHLAAGDVDTAAAEGRRLVDQAAEAGCRLMRARGERLLGQALTRSRPGTGARQHLEAALECFVQLEMPLEAARTRLALADAVVDEAPEVAEAEAVRALAVFVDLGAALDATAARTWLVHRGAHDAAPADGDRLGILTKRERELVGLLAEGLSNPEIAERLYISRRTVEHHVASILSKLGLRNRTEVAAYVGRAGGAIGAR